jgi:hypothetical protein
MTDRELALRRRIMRAFADTGRPPPHVEATETLGRLAAQHVVVLAPDDPTRILMAHPFAAHSSGARVDAGGRTWWGSCAWDGLGIVAALGLTEATVSSNGIRVRVREGNVPGDAVFHVAVPARHWWDDIAFT